jgi:hypothetical protein
MFTIIVQVGVIQEEDKPVTEVHETFQPECGFACFLRCLGQARHTFPLPKQRVTNDKSNQQDGIVIFAD